MRYLIDASERHLPRNKLKLKRKTRLHASAAIFSHFKACAGAKRRCRHITVDRFAHGWYWLIPLRDDVMIASRVLSEY